MNDHQLYTRSKNSPTLLVAMSNLEDHSSCWTPF